MTREQRYKYEMFVRVRDFGTAHAALFPESSIAGQAFARVATALGDIDEHLTNQVLGRNQARRVKATARAALYARLKTIAMAARRVTVADPSMSAFRLPRKRSLSAELATARAFIDAATARQEEFARIGAPPAFLSECRILASDVEKASEVRINAKTVRRDARAGLETAMAEGLNGARDLEVIVSIATREDPTTFAAWRAARQIEGQRRRPAKSPRVRARRSPGAAAVRRARRPARRKARPADQPSSTPPPVDARLAESVRPTHEWPRRGRRPSAD